MTNEQIAARLRAAGEDPMWANHAEVPKSLLLQAAAALEAQPAGDAGMPPRDPTKTNEQQGLFRKFIVRRTDGSDAPGGKHHGCDYFVLDVTHDRHAKAALAAYADAIEATHPRLASDMRTRWGLAAGDAGMPVVAQVSTSVGLHDDFRHGLFWFKAASKLQPSDYLVSQRDAQAAIAALQEEIAQLQQSRDTYFAERNSARDAYMKHRKLGEELQARINVRDARIAELERYSEIGKLFMNYYVSLITVGVTDEERDAEWETLKVAAQACLSGEAMRSTP